MDRMKMLERARESACDQIMACSALSDREYARLKKHKDDEKAVSEPALSFLKDAVEGMAAGI